MYFPCCYLVFKCLHVTVPINFDMHSKCLSCQSGTAWCYICILKHNLYTLVLIARKACSLIHFLGLHWGGGQGGTCPFWCNFTPTLGVQVNILTNTCRQRITTVWKNIGLQHNNSTLPPSFLRMALSPISLEQFSNEGLLSSSYTPSVCVYMYISPFLLGFISEFLFCFHSLCL